MTMREELGIKEIESGKNYIICLERVLTPGMKVNFIAELEDSFPGSRFYLMPFVKTIEVNDNEYGEVS